MSYRDFAASECQLLADSIGKKLEYMDKNPEEFDADTIGTEKEYAEKMLALIDAAYHTIRDEIPSDALRKDGLYFADIINDIFKGIPLTDLHSYEDNPDEWLDWKNAQVNSRYPNLVRRTLTLVDEEGNEKKQLFYTDFTRFSFFDLIANKKMDIESTGVAIQLTNVLDQLIPLTLPYNVKEDKIKVYLELFECSLQDGAEPVKTLALTHCMPKHAEKPTRIMKFFDITGGVMKEIDMKAYVTRRQIFEKNRYDAEDYQGPFEAPDSEE